MGELPTAHFAVLLGKQVRGKGGCGSKSCASASDRQHSLPLLRAFESLRTQFSRLLAQTSARFAPASPDSNPVKEFPLCALI